MTRRDATLAPLPDADLLGRFARHRDAAAFEQIVDRHGPMVLGVCRRVLRNSSDAEDAFQATFLLLAMRAAQIRDPDLVGNWLYGVAARTALTARRAAARRAQREKRLMQFLAPPKSTPIDDADLRMTLDEQVNKLPDRLRRVVVCCYLQGLTKRQAAKTLDWAEGTVTARLKEARELLKKRLGDQGLSEQSLASILAPVAVPALLHTATVNAGAAIATGKIAAAVSAKVLSMAKGTAKAIALAKLKLAAAVVVAAGVAVAGTAAVTQRPANSPPASTQPTQQAQAPANSIWNNGDMPTMRTALMSIQIYMNSHGGSFPPDLKSARVPYTFEYLANPAVKSRMIKRPYRLVALVARPGDDKAAPVVVGFIDGHAELLPAIAAEELIADAKAFFAAVKNAGDGPVPDAPGAPLPKPHIPPATATLPEDIRQALLENAAATNPIKLTWTRTASSPVGRDEAMTRYYVEPYFFAKSTERIALDGRKMYSWSDGMRGGVYENAIDGTNSYYISRGIQVGYGSNPLKGLNDANQYSCTYLEWSGLRATVRPSNLVNADPLTVPLLKQLADGAAVMAVEDSTLDGRTLKRIRIVAENDRHGMRYLPETRDYTYYLDPQLRFALRRTEESYGDRLIQRTDTEQLEPLSNRNAYLPGKIVRSHFNYKMVPDQFFTTPILTETLELTEVSTAPIPPEQFTLKPPPDVTSINGRIIRRPQDFAKASAANANSPGAAKSPGAAPTPLAPSPAEDVLANANPAAPAARPFWVLPAIAVAVVIVALLASVKWMKRAR